MSSTAKMPMATSALRVKVKWEPQPAAALKAEEKGPVLRERPSR